jgi:Heavy metal binding domain
MRRLIVTGALLVAAAVTSAAWQDAAVYMCPMHPEVRGTAGGRCPVCGMALVRASAADYEPYRLDFELTPRALEPQQRARVRFIIRRPRDGAIVSRFDAVHERIFHLFIVSHDLGFYAHVHPQLTRGGGLETEFELPRAGAYQFIADFLPTGAAPQILQRSFVTAGYEGPLGAVPELQPDLAAKTEQDTRITLSSPPARAGREMLLTFDVQDTATAKPATDLEPYLGATGHLLAVSADLGVAFHSHPVAEVSSAAGPTVVFQVLFPRAGMYRLWLQVQRHGRVLTVPFTVPVL